MLLFLKGMKGKACPKMNKPCRNGKSICLKAKFYWEIKKIISGKWVIPVLAGPVQKIMQIAVRRKRK
jgi:hypothetical protein